MKLREIKKVSLVLSRYHVLQRFTKTNIQKNLIFQRSLLMFLLGMSLNTIYGSNMLFELRIFGVLQRLAVAYLISAGFYALTAPKYYTPPRVSVRIN